MNHKFLKIENMLPNTEQKYKIEVRRNTNITDAWSRRPNIYLTEDPKKTEKRKI